MIVETRRAPRGWRRWQPRGGENTPRDAFDDAQLIGELRAGSIEAFETLYDRYCDRAFQVASVLCQSEQYAEHALQEAFVTLWRNKRTYSPVHGTVAAWVFSAVRNASVNHTGDNPETHANHAMDASRPTVPLNHTTDGLTLLSATPASSEPLSQLSGVPREVIALAIYAKLTPGEIASILDLSDRTVKAHMRSALQSLKATTTPSAVAPSFDSARTPASAAPARRRNAKLA